MDWNMILNELIKGIVVVASVVVPPAAAYIWSWIKVYIDAHVANQRLLRMAHEGEVVVGALAQSMVAPMKEAAADGKLTPEEIQKVKLAAMECLKARLTDLPKDMVTEVKLSQAIESAVGATKVSVPPAQSVVFPVAPVSEQK